MDRNILNFCLMLLVFVAGCCSYTYFHEQAHANIYRYFGVNSHTEVYGLGLFGGKTFPSDTNLTEARFNALYIAQSNVESIGYQLLPLIAMIGGLLMAGFMYVGYKIGEVER
jgi:hypothetical protein